MIVYSNTRIDNISKIERSVRLKIQKQTQMSLTWSLGKGVKEEHLRHEFLNRRRIANNLHCVKSFQIRSYFWSVFSCIRTEYEDLRSKILNETFRETAAEDVALFLFKERIGFAFVKTNLITKNNYFAKKNFTETLNGNASVHTSTCTFLFSGDIIPLHELFYFQVISQLKVLMRPDILSQKFDKEKWGSELAPILNLWKKLNQVGRFCQFFYCLTIVAYHIIFEIVFFLKTLQNYALLPEKNTWASDLNTLI